MLVADMCPLMRMGKLSRLVSRIRVALLRRTQVIWPCIDSRVPNKSKSYIDGVVPGREGLIHKYLQAYNDLENHHEQILQRRGTVTNHREAQKEIHDKHARWATQMREQGIPFEGPSKR